jgi:hypothetical protein
MTTRTQLGSFLFLAQFLLLDGYSSKVCRHQRKKKFIHSRKRKEKKNKLECEEEEEASGYSILALGLARRLCVDKSRKTKIFVKK